MSVQLAAQDFTTPNKGGDTFPLATMSASSTKPSFKSVTPTDNNNPGATNNTSSNNTTTTAITTTTTTTTTNKTVTPHTSSAMNAAAGKHVHFGAEEESKDNDSNSAAQSKRGLVSRRGGRYVSPGRPPIAPNTNSGASAAANKDQEYNNKTFRGDDSVPSLCSAPSNVGIVSLPSESEKDKDEEDSTPKRDGQPKSDGTDDPVEGDKKRPSSISCPTSLMEITSPLASKNSPRKDALSFDDADSKSVVVRSPVPSTSSTLKKTPIKSPGNFQSLPDLDDPKLGSPMGFILSPGPATPSYKTMRDSFEKETKEDKDGEISLKVRDYTKEKFALTPTNFMVDYGKSYASFDTSNVLNWLQSPTVNGLFSPGGLNSIMNTPKGPLVPRTPGTPTLSTSFFFSDVAGLKNGDTPKRGEGETVKSPKKGLSSIICISPLASTRNRGNAHSINTPINYHDIFASPNPLLEDSPVRGLLKRPLSKVKGANDPSFDATQAERDLMEDEDLSVLLQLAGGNTPKPMSVKSGGHVFRAGATNGDSLQLPIIGDREGDSSAARLLRKSHTRDGDKDSFPKPTLGIRKSTSSAADEAEHPGSSLSKQHDADTSKSHDPQPYPVHSHYPPRPPSSEMYGAYGMHHGMRPSGRMSVVVGGPPPSSRAPKASPAPRSHMSSSQRRPSYSHQDPYAPPAMTYPPPPHGHYPPHPGHMGMGGHHPYHSHYGPPPRHHPMPMYGAQPPHAGPKLTPKKAPKTTTKVATKQTLPTKRPSISSTGSGNEIGNPPAKKAKKSPSGRKKNKSPQLTDKVERQKAAQNIAAVNAASGGKNDKAAALAAAILRGVTMRPSGKWQAQLYFAGKSRYIGVFDTREKAALAYEIAREKLKSEKSAVDGALSPKQTENAVNAARKAAFDGVNEKDPRLSGK